MERLTLVHPDARHEEQVMAYRAEMLADGSSFDGCAGLEDVETYAEWLDFDGRLKEKFGGGYSPSDVFLALRLSDGRLVGILDFRKKLTEFLLNYGGSVGYSVRPGERRKGYAKEMLRLICRYCAGQGETRLLLTCDKENEASRRCILAGGGVLENEVKDDPELGSSGIIQRYWIRLEGAKGSE